MIASRYRDLALITGLAMIILLVFAAAGSAYTLRMLVEASCYAIIALGLTIQWGYAGLFNAGIMGFIALGGFMAMFISYPPREDFWASDMPEQLLGVIAILIAGIVLVFAATRLKRLGASRSLSGMVTLIVLGMAYMAFMNALDPVATQIERGPGFIGGLGLPVWLAWIMGGAVAGGVGYFIGRICLGLRADYLAIATLGTAEIIKALLKNADWLTRGTLTVSPLPWPVPGPGDIGFEAARASYLVITALMIVLIYILLQRAYSAPWGRMMRAIRDNEVSAASMGKDINKRRLEIFVFGCILMGIGGAALITFVGIFDPNGFLPLNHTFLIWVMVILGGAGNNLGAIFGALLVYVIWTMAEPATLFLFAIAETYGTAWFGWSPPDDLPSRALQMRVFVIGLTIALVLRFAPRGLMPEPVKRAD